MRVRGNPSSGVKPAANEVETHPLMAHRKLVGVCRRYGVVVIARAITGLGDARLTQHESLKKACDIETCGRARRGVEALLARWSAQRGVPFVVGRVVRGRGGRRDGAGFPPDQRAEGAGGRRWNRPRGRAASGSCIRRRGRGSRSTIRSSGGAARAGLELEKKGLLVMSRMNGRRGA